VNDFATPAELEAFLQAHPATRMIEVLHPDAHGILRGKRVGRDEWATLFSKGIKVCRAGTLLDVKGATVAELGLGSRDGDPDCHARPVAGTLAPVPWLDSRPAQLLMSLEELDGSPCSVDPRRILGAVVQRLHALGLRPVVATELEFYLVEEDSDGRIVPRLPRIGATRRRQDGVQYAITEELWELDGFLADVYAACEAQRVPAGATLAEFANGQYEINLQHQDDPVRACDHAGLFKRIVRGVAARHGLTATFMAKPFAEHAGSGLHIHASLYDEAGRNVFADPAGAAPPAHGSALRHAIGGLAATMAEGMAIFAPNANSYRRIVPGAYVPLTPNWGYNHRAVSLRVPVCDAANLRVEHRAAGADANPYLVMACVLAGIHHGLANRLEPASPMIGSGDFVEDPPVTVPYRWDAALDRFATATVLRDYLGGTWCRHYEINRRSECDRFHAEISDRDFSWYLRSV
jgi:glutamine synthetase